MAFDFFGLKDAVKVVGNVFDDMHTSDEERLKAELDFKKLDQELMLGQIEVNKEEAKSKSLFVAGWRPSLGWIGAIALAYQFILYPLLLWAMKVVEIKWGLPEGITPPPMLDTGALWTLLTGMLGIGGMRSLDKWKGTQTDKIN